MLLEKDTITVKQILFLMIGKGFFKCEIWNDEDYLKVHFGTKSMRSSLIATKYMDILISKGVPPAKAQQLVILKGKFKLTKKNLSLLGKPIITGCVEELSNHIELWDKRVTNIYIQGILRRKIIVLLENVTVTN